jgi:hypothetical protein
MVQRIRSDLDRNTTADDRIKQAIEDAIEFYRARRLGFNQKRATTNTAAGQEFYSLPTDFLEADALRIEEQANYYEPLAEVTFDWIDEHNGRVDHYSVPAKFAVQNRELRLFPIPDGTYELQLSYLYDLGGVSASASDGASNAWTDEAEQLVRLHAQADVLELYIGGQESVVAAQLLRGKAAAVYNELKRRANREQSTGRLRPWT